MLESDAKLSVQTTRSHDLAIGSAHVARSLIASFPRVKTVRFPLDCIQSQVHRVSLLETAPSLNSYYFSTEINSNPPLVKRQEVLHVAVPPSTQDVHSQTEDTQKQMVQRRRIRIAPPGDVVKLSERLFFMLQPDLESTLQASNIDFPKEPFPFQLDGMAFLMPRHGAILADEMGLGKSMQAISSLRLLIHSGQARQVLVVCPKGLVSNWARELSEWAPELVVAVVEGDPTRRCWQWKLEGVPVKVANYEAVVRDREMIEELGLSFDLVVLDEAQRIKNRSSNTHSAIGALRRGRSWALTGTPVENSATDLVSLFDFIAPGQVNESMSPKTLGVAAADYVLRRTKDKVLTEMPPRMNRDESIELTPEQQDTYLRAEEDGVVRLSELGHEASIQNVFELILRLKQICNFDPSTGRSAKLDCLIAELEEVQASGKKALVFSQWVDTLGRIERKLGQFGALQYHGGMSTAARDRAIEQFKNDSKHSVLLLSYGAGAVGLNLQFSQYVFLFDRWWNPAIEDQAINRAHRIGAAGAVTVTRFLSAGTIEERIDEVLQRKRDLSETILSQAEAPAASGLSANDLFALFRLPAPRQAAA